MGGLRYDSMWNHSDFISSSFVVFWLSCWFYFSAITWHRNLVQYDCGYFVSVSVCVCVFRLGKPASGNRFSGDLLVSAVESGTDATPLPTFAYLHLDLPLARSPHHAGCGQYAYMHSYACSHIWKKRSKSTTPSDDFCLGFLWLLWLAHNYCLPKYGGCHVDENVFPISTVNEEEWGRRAARSVKRGQEYNCL